MPVVARINVFPVKSCDGLSCTQAEFAPGGGLRHDRQFALVDSSGRFINAKRTNLIHQLRLQIEPSRREFLVANRNGENELSGRLDEQGRELSDWLSHFFSMDVSIVENDETGFPDDLESPGPTVISSATFQTVADWFGLPIDNVRQRFRANIEIDGVEPFWEDRLYRADKQPQPFRIGQVLIGGTNPCQRCVVPTRDPISGLAVPAGFAQEFAKRRELTLPDWAPKERFNHFYRLSTNTLRLDKGSGTITVGDSVELVS